MVYGPQITIIFMGFINQLITGGPHIVGMRTDEDRLPEKNLLRDLNKESIY